MERAIGPVMLAGRTLPDLAFVPAEDVLLHEECDPERVARLRDRLRSEGILKNPPIAAPMGGQVVVLDGANRTEALRALGARTVLLQRVDYTDPSVELGTWRHLIAEPPPEVEERIRCGLPVEPLPSEEATEAARRGRILASVWVAGRCFALPRGNTLPEDAARLRALVSAYKGTARIYRVLGEDPEDLERAYGRVGMLVVFCTFTKAEILAIARDGAKLPTGITRHVIPGRALRVNVPLGRMLGGESLGALNGWLEGWVQTKLLNHEVRYYAEPTFLFDE